MSRIVIFALVIGLWTPLSFAQREPGCNYPIEPTASIVSFVDNADGTVTDSRFGLMWKRCAEGVDGSQCNNGTVFTGDWQAALQAAAASTFAGYTDWRVPNIKELASIHEYKCYAPALDPTVFPTSPNNLQFWSSSPVENNRFLAWYTAVFVGISGVDQKAVLRSVRLVRDVAQ